MCLQILKDTGILAGIQGGYNVHDRTRCAETMSKAEVDGFVIDGLFTNGLEVENITFEDIEPVIKVTMVICLSFRLHLILA